MTLKLGESPDAQSRHKIMNIVRFITVLKRLDNETRSFYSITDLSEIETIGRPFQPVIKIYPVSRKLHSFCLKPTFPVLVITKQLNKPTWFMDAPWLKYVKQYSANPQNLQNVKFRTQKFA